MTRELPAHANLEHLRKQAKRLLRDLRAGKPAAATEFHSLVPIAFPGRPKLADVQRAVAREYGFDSWPRMKKHVESVARGSGVMEAPVPTSNGKALAEPSSTVEEVRRKEEDLFIPDHLERKGADGGELDDRLPLYRKRQFDSDIPTLLGKSSEHAPLSLLFLDLDHFKQVNDRYGHPVGDEVLLEVASTLKAICAAKGHCYRWGGEELAVLLPNYASGEAASLAERVRHGVSKLEFQNYPHNVTISVGVACHPETSPTAERLVKDADNAMYQAKQNGRNQVFNAISLKHADSRRPARTRTLTEKPTLGRRTIPDNFLLGARNAWAALLEESWPEIGSSLLCIRDRPSSTIEDVKKTFEPVKRNPHNPGLAAGFYHESAETATAADIRMNREKLGKLQAQIHHTQAKHDELERSSREAEAALTGASPGDEQTIREEATRRLKCLHQVGDDLIKLQSEGDVLDKQLRDQEAFVSRSELLDFLLCEKYAVTPRNLANAVAGLPSMKWRQSVSRCSTMPFNEPYLHYRVFETISKIWGDQSQEFEDPPVRLFRTKLLKLSKKAGYARQFLCDNWNDLRLAIEECWKSKQSRESIPFVVTSVFMRNATKQKNPVERILAEREKLEG
jgi:diguanylate cyclase (GGDEF)-like protein